MLGTAVSLSADTVRNRRSKWMMLRSGIKVEVFLHIAYFVIMSSPYLSLIERWEFVLKTSTLHNPLHHIPCGSYLTLHTLFASTSTFLAAISRWMHPALVRYSWRVELEIRLIVSSFHIISHNSDRWESILNEETITRILISTEEREGNTGHPFFLSLLWAFSACMSNKSKVDANSTVDERLSLFPVLSRRLDGAREHANWRESDVPIHWQSARRKKARP